MSKISELSDGGSIQASDYLVAVRSGGNVKVRMDQINVDQVDLGDNEFIRLGNSQDLTLVHNASNSIINQAGIGDLLIQKAGTTKASFTTNGLEFPDNSKAIFGAGSDLQIYHDGSNSYIDDAGTGELLIRGSAITRIQSYAGEDMVVAVTNGSVNLYHNNSKKLETTATGVDVTGTVTADLFSGSLNAFDPESSSAMTAKNNFKIDIDSDNTSTLRTFTVTNDGETKTLLNVAEGGDLSLYEDTGTTAKFFWDASTERLGVGTITPNAPVDAQLSGSGGLPVSSGTAQTYGSLRVGATSFNTILDMGTAGATGAWLQASDKTALGTNYSLLLNPNGGNVGIGVTPTNPLSVYSASGSANINLTRTGTSESLQIGTFYINANGNDLGLATLGSHPMTFKTNNVERMRIDADGNLLVGLTSISDATSRAYGNAFAGSGANPNWKSWGSGSHTHAQFRNGTSAVGSITSTSSATAYNTSSDQRLKDNIVDAPSASDDIDAIQVRSFDWKADGEHQKYGMVAQELQAVAPEAVSGDADSDEMMGVDYSKLVPMMLKEIQSLRARVAQLES